MFDTEEQQYTYRLVVYQHSQTVASQRFTEVDSGEVLVDVKITNLSHNASMQLLIGFMVLP